MLAGGTTKGACSVVAGAGVERIGLGLTQRRARALGLARLGAGGNPADAAAAAAVQFGAGIAVGRAAKQQHADRTTDPSHTAAAQGCGDHVDLGLAQGRYSQVTAHGDGRARRAGRHLAAPDHHVGRRPDARAYRAADADAASVLINVNGFKRRHRQ